MSESNTAVGRPLPLWPYSASDNVSRSLGSEPDKIAINLSMSFVDFPWRYAHVPQAEIAVAPLSEHRARRAAGRRRGRDDESAGSAWADRRKSRSSSGTHDTRISTSARRTPRACCCSAAATRASYRGFFRLLSEQHIPFVVSENLRWLDDRTAALRSRDRAGRGPRGLERYVRDGGRCWSPARRRPRSPIGRIVGRRTNAGLLAHP